MRNFYNTTTVTIKVTMIFKEKRKNSDLNVNES